MDGSLTTNFWQGQSFWFTLAIPSIIWVISFLLMLRTKYKFRGLIWVFAIASFMLIFASNAIRRIAVDLVRNNQIALLETLNNVLANGQVILILIALAIAYFNIAPRALWPLLCAFFVNAIIRYSIWFTNLMAFYI